MRKLYVRRSDVIEADEAEVNAGEWVEVVVAGDKRCARYRVKAVLPDVEALLSEVNSNFSVVAGMIDDVLRKVGALERKMEQGKRKHNKKVRA